MQLQPRHYKKILPLRRHPTGLLPEQLQPQTAYRSVPRREVDWLLMIQWSQHRALQQLISQLQLHHSTVVAPLRRCVSRLRLQRQVLQCLG